jgi:uncharacterized SAM-binding protein YcdF (DUF218 family)
MVSMKTSTRRTAAPLWQYRLGRYAAVLFMLANVVVGGWLVRERVLVGAADLWSVSDSTTRADAIVVLGGGPETRPVVAAELWRRGLADKILVSQGSEDRNRLLKMGVPADAIEKFGTAITNTRDEAVALREWAERNPASVFIIPSEIFSARRVRWIFRRQFSGTAVSIEVPSFEPPDYTRWNWWKTEKGLATFRTELLKYMYYRLRY